MTIAAIVQARSGSERFPGKVLADLEGAPLLARLLRRLARTEECDVVAVATSTAAADDAVAELADSEGFPTVRGPLLDVLERYRAAAEVLSASTVVRITGDCPLVDAALVDDAVRRFRESGVAYASNVHPPTLPDGLDIEVVARSALDEAAAAATEPGDREHVTLFIARQPDRFPQLPIIGEDDRSWMRWTVDYPDDLEFVRGVFRHFAGVEDRFTSGDVFALLDREPDLFAAMPRHRRNERLEPWGG